MPEALTYEQYVHRNGEPKPVADAREKHVAAVRKLNSYYKDAPEVEGLRKEAEAARVALDNADKAARQKFDADHAAPVKA